MKSLALSSNIHPGRCGLTSKQQKSGQTEQQLDGTENSKSRSKAERKFQAEHCAAHAEPGKENEDVRSIA